MLNIGCNPGNYDEMTNCALDIDTYFLTLSMNCEYVVFGLEDVMLLYATHYHSVAFMD